MSNDLFDTEEKVFGQKLDNIEYTDRIGVYGIVINEEGNIAVIKTPGGYFLPGGGIENSESHEECIKREFIEETGYDIEIKKYIGSASIYHITRTNQYKRGIGYYYIVNLKDKTHDKVEDDHELIWIDAEECNKKLFLENQAWAVSKALKEEN